MKTLARKPKTVRPLTDTEAENAANRLTLTCQFLLMAQMVQCDVPPMRHEWKREFDALWRQAGKCLSLIHGLPEDDDDTIHDIAAIGVRAAMSAIEAHCEQIKSQQHQPA